MQDGNRRRQALEEIVTLEARHESFTTSRRVVDLHVDAVFTEGRISGGEASDVRFRLRLKRAQVVIIIPASEPCMIEPRSVKRDGRKLKATYKETKTGKKSTAAKFAATVGVNWSGFSSAPIAKGEFLAESIRKTETKTTEDISSMRVTQRRGGNDYVWIIEPGVDDFLNGRPWDAEQEPRLRVRDKRSDGSKQIEPSIRIEVRCLREDLDIHDIVINREGRFVSVLTDPFGRNKLAAAEAVIRTRLFQEGLTVGDMADPFAQLILCAVVAEN